MELKLKVNNEGKLVLDMHDLLAIAVENTADDDLWKLVEMLGWQERIFKLVSVALTEEYSRENYNTYLHEARADFLKHIKEEEVKYYASVISNKICDAKRHSDAYWKLHHWCRENDIKGYPYDTLMPTDFNWKLQLEKTIQDAFSEKVKE